MLHQSENKRKLVSGSVEISFAIYFSLSDFDFVFLKLVGDLVGQYSFAILFCVWQKLARLGTLLAEAPFLTIKCE